MRSRLTEPLTLRDIARDLDRQAEYLGWLFHHETGTTFRARLTSMRLRLAARLIRAGEKIEAVALLVGYRSKKNFYEQFRRRFGITPGEYRNRFRGGRPATAGERTSRRSGPIAGRPIDEHPREVGAADVQ
jgi:transcriptional regulator GlxA family with amidase domain